MTRTKPTVTDVLSLKNTDYKITAVTAVNYFQALFADMAGVDAVVVNDVAYSRLELGRDSNWETSVDEIIKATQAVKRGSGACFVITSLPFGTYSTPEDALKNATRIIKESDCDAVHIEGGRPEVIAKVTENGIPVLAHIGITKVNIGATGVTRVRGGKAEQAEQIIQDALQVEKAGAFGTVVECVPAKVAKIITETLKIPTVGIGAGPYVNGQFLVTEDMLGMLPDFNPRFVKKYAALANYVVDAFKKFNDEAKSGAFPSSEYYYGMKDDEYAALLDNIKTLKKVL